MTNAADEKAQHQAMINREPLWYSRQLATHPLRVFLACLATILLIIVIVGASGRFELSDSGDRDYLIADDEFVMKYTSIDLAKADLEDENVVEAERLNNDALWRSVVMFESDNGGNLLTVNRLEKIREIETYILTHPRYRDFCWAALASPNCTGEAYQSVLDFYPEGSTQAEIDAIALAHSEDDSYYFFYGSDFTSGSPTTAFLRSFFEFGKPIAGYNNGQDEPSKQLSSFQSDFLADISDYIYEDKPGADVGVTSYIVGNAVWSQVFQKVLDRDMLFAVGSFTFVFSYVTFHTRSFFLSSFGLLGILFSFPVTFFFYNLVFQIAYFQFLQLLSIFVILGIGADDIFVYVDAWKQVILDFPEAADNLQLRIDLCYRRAVKAMLVTSLTTMAAFFCTAMSPIMPISSFGIFAGVLVGMNYAIVITLFPSVVVLWEQYFRHKSCCPCIPCCRVATEKENENEHSARGSSIRQVEETEDREITVEDMLAYSKIEQFFTLVWAPLIFRFRKPLTVAGVVTVIVMLSLALQMGPLTEQEQFFPDDYPFQQGMELLDSVFHQSATDSVVKVDIVWGINGLDREGVDFYDFSFLGEVEYDAAFNLLETTSQEFLLSACSTLRNSSLVFGQPEAVRCWIEDFQAYKAGLSEPFPVDYDDEAALVTELKAFLVLPQAESYLLEKDIGIDEADDFLYTKIYAVGTFPLYLPRSETLPQREAWDALINGLNDIAPAPMNNAFHSSHPSWTWMSSEAAFISSALSGMAISLSISFVVLVLSSTNYIVAAFATLTIIGIVSSVIALMFVSGWDLGVIESVSMVILIGFSIDYTVHLANAYVDSHRSSRKWKTQDALREMGVSVFAGACTTFGSSLFLFGANTIFFQKFAVLLSSTVFFALVWSLVFFSSLCSWFGPEGRRGSILPWISAIRAKLGYPEKEEPQKTIKVAPSRSGDAEIEMQDAPSANKKRLSTTEDAVMHIVVAQEDQ